MLSKLILLGVVLIFSVVNVACDGDEQCHGNVTRDARDTSMFDSFSNLFDKIKHFFGVKKKDIDASRKRIKNAIERFFKEFNKPNTNLRARLGYPDDIFRRPKLNNRSSTRDYKIRPETNVQQLIATHGYRSESHTLLTTDGYMLSLQRILPDVERAVSRRVVLLHHGLFASAEDWLFLGHQRALPYMLTDKGFDVWLLNARGNRYSKIHTHKNTNRDDFWDFSWHEIGVYDLPAVIKYVREVTHKAEINFIGHSMGATALLALLTTSPEYNYILRSGILLAPLAFMYNVKGPMKALANFYRINGEHSLNFLGKSELLPNAMLPDPIIQRYCKGDERTCYNPLLLIANGGLQVSKDKIYHDVLSHVPAGGSLKTLIHYLQLVKSGYFQMFDYGPTNNLIKYGNRTPPLYNLEQVTLPMAIFSSPSDWLATATDIQTLLPLLQYVNLHHVVKMENFSHLDFLWSPDAPEFVYDFILGVLDKITLKDERYFDD